MAADRLRRGFALFAVLVIFAVGAILATVIYVTLSGDNDQARIEKAADVLHRLAAEIDTSRVTTGQSFAGQVTVWPGKLSELYTKITASDKQCNGTGFLTTQVNNWRGPYHLVTISTAGHNIALGFVAQDALVKVSNSDEAITITTVALDAAKRLDLFVDKVADAVNGVVSYTPTGSSPVTVSYHIKGI